MIGSRLKSFAHAFTGIGTLVAEQTNARIHALATLVVIVGGAALELTYMEWIAVTVAVAMVWCAEAMNTAIEYICDLVEPEENPLVRRAKDVAAGGVLVCAIAAIVVALLILVNHQG